MSRREKAEKHLDALVASIALVSNGDDAGTMRRVVHADYREALLDFCCPEPCPDRRAEADRMVRVYWAKARDLYQSPDSGSFSEAGAAKEALLDFCGSAPAALSPAEDTALGWGADALRRQPGGDHSVFWNEQYAHALDGIRTGAVVFDHESPKPVFSPEESAALEEAARTYRLFSKTMMAESFGGDSCLATAETLDGIRERCVVQEPVFVGLTPDEERALRETAAYLRLTEDFAPPFDYGKRHKIADVFYGLLNRGVSDSGPTFTAVVADRDRLASEVIDLKSRGIVLLRERDGLKSEVIDLKAKAKGQADIIAILNGGAVLAFSKISGWMNANLLDQGFVDGSQVVGAIDLMRKGHHLEAETTQLKADLKLTTSENESLKLANGGLESTVRALRAEVREYRAEPRSSVPAPADLGKMLNAVGERAVDWHLAADRLRQLDGSGTGEAVEAAEGAYKVACEAVKAAFEGLAMYLATGKEDLERAHFEFDSLSAAHRESGKWIKRLQAEAREPCDQDNNIMLARDFYGIIKRIAEIADTYDTKPVGPGMITSGLSRAGAKALAEETNSATITLSAIVGRIRGESRTA